MKHIFDKDFVYVPANKTDIRETFRRITKAAPQVPSDKDGPLMPSPAVLPPKVLLMKGRA